MSKNTDDAFHGGFVRNVGNASPAVVLPKRNEMANADPTTALARLSETEGANVYPNIKHPLKARSTKLACLGIPSAVLDAGDPAYSRTVRMANSYKKVRIKELFQAHGYVSQGVSALLAAASLALSGSRYLYEIAANTPINPAEGRGLGLPQLLKLASSLSDSARQNELSAWELCAREAVIKKRNDGANTATPWVITQSPSPNGQQKRGRGRPRKVQPTNPVVDAVFEHNSKGSTTDSEAANFESDMEDSDNA